LRDTIRTNNLPNLRGAFANRLGSLSAAGYARLSPAERNEVAYALVARRFFGNVSAADFAALQRLSERCRHGLSASHCPEAGSHVAFLRTRTDKSELWFFA